MISRTTLRNIPALLATAALLLSSSAWALEKNYVDQPKKAEEKVSGWDGQLTLGANISLAHSSNVVGSLDGLSFLFGLTINGDMDYAFLELRASF